MCLSSGAEHWIDFKECVAAESDPTGGPITPVVKEIVKVCGGVGAHAAVIVSPSVGILSLYLDDIHFL